MASTVADLARRVETVQSSIPETLGGQLNDFDLRFEKLEHRVEELSNTAPGLPPVDQLLAAVDNLVSTRIGGLDERLADQVHAIELLREASSQTDALVQKLILAVEGLAAQAAEQQAGIETRATEEGEAGDDRLQQRGYPVA